jgi:hypothetical protein
VNAQRWGLGGGGETYRAISTLETIQSLFARRPLISGHNCLDGLLREIPKLVVVILQQNKDTGCLAVE